MENHFILNLPDNLAIELHEDLTNNIISNIKIEYNDKCIKYVYKNISYETIFYNLPTIIEAQKTFDKKQFYKVCDISNCLYVFDDTRDSSEAILRYNEGRKYSHDDESNRDLELEEEMLNDHVLLNRSDEYKKVVKARLETSGISESLKYAKIRYFKKKNEKMKMAEFRDKKVNELIEREKCSDSVSIQFADDEYGETDDLSSLAAELENALIEDRIDKNPLIQEGQKNYYRDQGIMNNMKRTGNNVKVEESLTSENDVMSRRRLELNQELDVIEEKIKKKEEQLSSVTNLILKQRFEDNLVALNKEKEIKKEEIKKLNCEK